FIPSAQQTPSAVQLETFPESSKRQNHPNMQAAAKAPSSCLTPQNTGRPQSSSSGRSRARGFNYRDYTGQEQLPPVEQPTPAESLLKNGLSLTMLTCSLTASLIGKSTSSRSAWS